MQKEKCGEEERENKMREEKCGKEEQGNKMQKAEV